MDNPKRPPIYICHVESPFNKKGYTVLMLLMGVYLFIVFLVSLMSMNLTREDRVFVYGFNFLYTGLVLSSVYFNIKKYYYCYSLCDEGLKSRHILFSREKQYELPEIKNLGMRLATGKGAFKYYEIEFIYQRRHVKLSGVYNDNFRELYEMLENKVERLRRVPIGFWS